jgi:predicted  nucleic acid-binding Zn-ribbon protein
MANNSKNDDFPTIRLDDEDRRDYQKKRQPSPTSSSVSPSTPPPAHSNAGSSSGNGLWITLIAVFALGACGGCYYLYTLLEQQRNAANAAEQRIVQLENKLSATGEEIGESTVALQVKVTELSNRTNELWEQMDKLWASAWRRNQKEIADLGARVGNVQNATNASISSVADDVKAQNAEIGSVKNQLATLADEVLALNVQLEQASNGREQSEQNVRALTDKLKILEQRNTALSGRVSGLENDIRDIATKVVSSSGTGIPPSPEPSSLPVN